MSGVYNFLLSIPQTSRGLSLGYDRCENLRAVNNASDSSRLRSCIKLKTFYFALYGLQLHDDTFT